MSEDSRDLSRLTGQGGGCAGAFCGQARLCLGLGRAGAGLPPGPSSQMRKEAGPSRLGYLRRMQTSRAAQTLASGS